MIRHLRGLLLRRSPTDIIVDVGGVGYGLAISLATYDRLPVAHEEAVLFTYTHVREDRLQLFGFADEDERDMFELLIGVSGIGPTSALTVLSGIPLKALQTAIFEERVSDLTRVRGIGKKTAERVVVELKDKIRFSMVAGTGTDAAQPGEGTGVVSAVQEATMALIALGFQAPAAKKAMERAQKENGVDATVQELIRHALRNR